MEDADAAELSLDEEAENSNAFFAVYDGHGGRKMAKFAAINVHKRLVTEEAYRDKRYAEALKRAFLGTDEDFLADPTNDDPSDDDDLSEDEGSSDKEGSDEEDSSNDEGPSDGEDSSGCTAIAALVTGNNKIYVANAGDSRSVLSVRGKVKPLSVDQKPSDPSPSQSPAH
jgi:protein phosphatase 2C family protein 2/3